MMLKNLASRLSTLKAESLPVIINFESTCYLELPRNDPESCEQLLVYTLNGRPPQTTMTTEHGTRDYVKIGLCDCY